MHESVFDSIRRWKRAREREREEKREPTQCKQERTRPETFCASHRIASQECHWVCCSHDEMARPFCGEVCMLRSRPLLSFSSYPFFSWFSFVSSILSLSLSLSFGCFFSFLFSHPMITIYYLEGTYHRIRSTFDLKYSFWPGEISFQEKTGQANALSISGHERYSPTHLHETF